MYNKVPKKQLNELISQIWKRILKNRNKRSKSAKVSPLIPAGNDKSSTFSFNDKSSKSRKGKQLLLPLIPQFQTKKGSDMINFRLNVTVPDKSKRPFYNLIDPGEVKKFLADMFDSQRRYIGPDLRKYDYFELKPGEKLPRNMTHDDFEWLVNNWNLSMEDLYKEYKKQSEKD